MCRLACKKVSTRSCRRESSPTRTFSNMKFRSSQLPLPLSGPNMGCVHKTSICMHTMGTDCLDSRSGNRDSGATHKQAYCCIGLTLQLTNCVPSAGGHTLFHQFSNKAATALGALQCRFGKMHLSVPDQRMPQQGQHRPSPAGRKQVLKLPRTAQPWPIHNRQDCP